MANDGGATRGNLSQRVVEHAIYRAAGGDPSLMPEALGALGDALKKGTISASEVSFLAGALCAAGEAANPADAAKALTAALLLKRPRGASTPAEQRDLAIARATAVYDLLMRERSTSIDAACGRVADDLGLADLSQVRKAYYAWRNAIEDYRGANSDELPP